MEVKDDPIEEAEAVDLYMDTMVGGWICSQRCQNQYLPDPKQPQKRADALPCPITTGMSEYR